MIRIHPFSAKISKTKSCQMCLMPKVILLAYVIILVIYLFREGDHLYNFSVVSMNKE